MERFKEYVYNQKPAEFAIEYYYKKPLKACSFQEIMDATILKWRIVGGLDMIDCKDNGEFCTINIIHSMGLNFSKILVMEQESLHKSCGIKIESDFSDRSVFFKIHKK
jgi:hypothetical protein